MTTYVLNGVTIAPGAIFVSTTQLTIVISDEGLLEYQYSNNDNNPGFGILEFESFTIPEAYFPTNDQIIPPDTNSFLNLSPYGNDAQDEAFFFEVVYSDGSRPQSAVLFSIYDASEDVDHVFVLSSTDPNFSIPSSTAEFNAFFGTFGSVSQVTSGPFAPNAPVDFSQIFPATLYSVSDVDVWIGDEEGEFFDGGAGNDSLSGEGGGDVLVGGAGNDTIDGGTSTDDDGREHLDAVVYSLEEGPNGVSVNLGTNSATDSFGDTDVLNNIEAVAGTAFADTLIGDANDNIFAGGDGADSIDGGDGEDEVDFSFLGNDSMGVDVDLANETAVDSWGNTDTIQNIENVFGSDFDDTISGDGEDNVLVGGGGDDSLFGDGGNDYFIPSSGGGEFDTVNGGEGQDTLRFFASYLDEDLGFVISPTGSATITNGTDTVAVSGVEVLELNDASLELDIGTEGADTLGGGSIGAILLGLGGDDILTGTDVTDALFGGAGNDTLSAGAGDDLVSGGDDNDLIIVGTGAGNDLFDGGDGVDTLRVDTREFADWSFIYNLDLVDGFSGALGSTVGADSVTGIEALEFIGNLDVVVAGDVNDNYFATDTGDDVVTGAGGNDTISGGSGSDRLEGGEGDDVIRGNRGGDLIYGDDGFDSLYGDIGSDTIYGGTGFDTIEGGSQDDELHGEAGNDVISGQNGDDLIYGGAGFDTIYGDGGRDTIYGGGGNDVIEAGAGFDVVRGEAGNDLIYGGDLRDVLVGGRGNDTLYGEHGNDRLVGNAGADSIIGGDGRDGLFGGLGQDTLLGGSGEDLLKGAQGDDVIDGGTGNDTMSGGADTDTFVFGSNHGIDVITDFDANGELIDLTTFAEDFSELTINTVAADAVVAGVGAGVLVSSTEGSILLEGVAFANVGVDDFLFADPV